MLKDPNSRFIVDGDGQIYDTSIYKTELRAGMSHARRLILREDSIHLEVNLVRMISWIRRQLGTVDGQSLLQDIWQLGWECIAFYTTR